MKRSVQFMLAAFSAALIAGPALAEFPERNIENIYPWGTRCHHGSQPGDC